MKINPIAAVPELDDLFALIAFLRDVDAVEARVKLLEKLRTDINERIEIVGKAEEIDVLLTQARTDRHQAGEELAEAKSQAKKLLEDAAQANVDAKARHEAHVKAQLAQIEEMRSGISEQTRSLTMQAAEQSAKATELQRMADQANRVLAEGKAMQKEYEAKLAKLRAAGVV